MKCGTKGVGVPFGEHEPRFFEEFCVLPNRMSPEEDGCVLGRDRGTVAGNGRYSGEFKDRMSRPVDFLGGRESGTEPFEN